MVIMYMVVVMKLIMVSNGVHSEYSVLIDGKVVDGGSNDDTNDEGDNDDNDDKDDDGDDDSDNETDTDT